MSNQPKILLVYEEEVFQSEEVQRIMDQLKVEGVLVSSEALPPKGPFAGIDWCTPTYVIAFITGTYFSGFLNEAGKDHYKLLKKYISKLWGKIKNRGRATVIVTRNKLREDNPYSYLFSIEIAFRRDYSIKMLIQNELSEEELSNGLELLKEFIVSGREPEIKYWNKVLVAYDPKLDELVFLNPMRR